MLTVYSTKTCVWCKQVKKYLSLKGVSYEEVFLDEDLARRQELFQKTGFTSVPITTDGESFVVGWNVSQLNSLISAQK